MRRMLREVVFVRDEKAGRLLLLCDLFVFLFCCTVLSGGPIIPKDKRSNFKRSNSKRSKFKRSKSKRSKNLLLFGMKRSNCFFSDFFVAFCETLLGEERLACIFEMFRPIHIISHERRQKQTTNCGLSVGRCCGGSYFPVWCSHTTIACALPAHIERSESVYLTQALPARYRAPALPECTYTVSS